MCRFRLPKVKNLVYLGILLMIIKTILFYSVVFYYPPFIDSILQYSALFCFVISIISQKFNNKTIIIYALITLISVYSCFRVKEWGMLITVITVLAIRKENINDIIYFIYKYELLVVCLHVLLAICMSFFGLPITSTYKGELVLTLGFVHRNALSALLFNLIMMWLWINFKKINNQHIVILILFQIALFIFVKTKTSIIIFGVIFTLILMYRKRISNSKLLKNISASIVPVFTVVLYYLTSTFGSKISLIIDSILTGRLRFNGYLLYTYGLSLFGQEITNYYVNWDDFWQLSGILTFDCLYTYLIISRGIVWTIIISILFYKLARKKINVVNIFVIAWALYGITEIGGVNCYMSFPILLVTLLFDKKIEELKEYENKLE